jgi:hypothetical protein
MANPGFYKNDNGNMLYGVVSVTAPTYTLLASNPMQASTTAAPVDGWRWFNADTDAYTAYGLTMPAPASHQSLP